MMTTLGMHQFEPSPPPMSLLIAFFFSVPPSGACSFLSFSMSTRHLFPQTPLSSFPSEELRRPHRTVYPRIMTRDSCHPEHDPILDNPHVWHQQLVLFPLYNLYLVHPIVMPLVQMSAPLRF